MLWCCILYLIAFWACISADAGCLWFAVVGGWLLISVCGMFVVWLLFLVLGLDCGLRTLWFGCVCGVSVFQSTCLLQVLWLGGWLRRLRVM